MDDRCAGARECSTEYPCVTKGDHYACAGQFAEWPMPDRVSGAKAAPSYRRSADNETVTDSVTGLMWEARLPPQYAECVSRSGAPSHECTRAEATAHCSALTLAGFDDWRLPSKIEIESLLDVRNVGEGGTVLNGTAMELQAGTAMPPWGFWTSSPYAGPEGGSWVLFAWGGTTRFDVEFAQVWCVRAP
ncbi:MAG TPA: DUF1566 domain-containing protein [Polyangiales bacterium]|nr:DUF1566 domain-containing protein [Polyangiales bacterium]